MTIHPKKGRSGTWRLGLYGACTLLALPTLALAGDTYEIPSATIDGGGGTSSSATFTLTGTIGQSDASAASLEIIAC